jgi:hypothetical protein
MTPQRAGGRLREMLVHADLKVDQHEHRRLQPLGKVERLRRERERLAGVLREHTGQYHYYD